jgi:hypothetical protein
MQESRESGNAGGGSGNAQERKGAIPEEKRNYETARIMAKRTTCTNLADNLFDLCGVVD